MSIRLKILLTTIFAIVFTLAGVVTTMTVQLEKSLISNFEVTSKAQLARVNAFVDLFFQNALRTAELIANSPETINNLDNLTSYANVSPGIAPVGEKLPEHERKLFFELKRFQSVDKAIDFVYVGSSNGGFTQSPDDVLGDNFHPAKRPWFIQSQAAGKPVVTEVYLSDDGNSVCTATAPVKGIGTTQGVVGIDISLETLTRELGKATIGNTGYMLLIDAQGVIVNEPKLPSKEKAGWAGNSYTAKAVPQDVQKVLAQLQETKAETAEVTFFDRQWLAGVTTTAEGWTLIMFQEKDEIFAHALEITFDICKIGVLILLVMAALAYFLSRSIAGPVAVLANAAQQVAKGDLNAIPEQGKGFTGELGVLHLSLKSMVAKLVELIGTAEGKIKEAEAALALSKESLQQAEEAKAQAENARREGVLQTAQQLASIVTQLSDAARNLSVELQETDKNVSDQKMRVTETATAMSQMNVAIGEVASSISRTSQLAEVSRSETIAGKHLVQDVMASIAEVDNQSKTMRQSLEVLGGQVTDIGAIMVVINDIADQTNLLALNAAIEAARAGDAGRGFAVVADEVRKLAENTMQATKQVGTAISSIQKGTESNMRAMAETTTFVAKSTELVGKAGEALNSIEGIVNQTADEVRAIATASEEQSATAEEINRSTDTVSHLANGISDGSNRAQQAVQEVTKLAAQVEHVINELRKS